MHRNEKSNKKGYRQDSDRDFKKYLLAEYNNIAEAHFRTISAISSFFRYYLIIMALPITLFSAFLGLSLKEGQIIYPSGLLLSIVCLVIALVGFLVLVYMINLRMDVILYARTVNAIRKYFYDEADVDVDVKIRMRVLPQTPFFPGYFERGYFLPVVMSFALFNSIYLVGGLVLFTTPLSDLLQLTSWDKILTWAKSTPWWMWTAITFFFFIHLLSYVSYSHHREHSYLRSHAMGIDLDGVLNLHRDHFCRLLDENLKKKMKPEQITTIPIHEDLNLGVSRDEEKKVFNDPSYWAEMPPAQDAAYNIRRLRNALKLKILIFTHRPWPSEEIKESESTYRKWEDTASQMFKSSVAGKPLGKLREGIVKARMKIKIRPFNLGPIDLITKCWLSRNNIEYNELIIERASEDVSEPGVQFCNRFYISRQRRLRFFVEDDHEKAAKLAYICDIVFLVDQPYNTGKNLPDNVLRVKSWDEIYRWIRKLS